MAHATTTAGHVRPKRFLGLVLNHRLILSFYLGIVAIISLLYFLLPAGRYDATINLAVCTLALAMFFTIGNPSWHPLVVHTLTVLAVSLALYIGWFTGGLYSGAMIWLGVLVPPARPTKSWRPNTSLR